MDAALNKMRVRIKVGVRSVNATQSVGIQAYYALTLIPASCMNNSHAMPHLASEASRDAIRSPFLARLALT